MFYRVAIRPNAMASWQWRSTRLSSLEALFAFLRQYQAIPQDRVKVFSAATREELDEQLAQANYELEIQAYSTSHVTVPLSLQEASETSSLASSSVDRYHDGQLHRSNRSSARNALPYGAGINMMEKRRLEMEQGEGGDHDASYLFTLPTSTPQMLAWIQLRARVQRGELEA